MQALKTSVAVAAPAKVTARVARASPVMATLRVDKLAKAAGAGIATLALTLSANAVTVKLGADGGEAFALAPPARRRVGGAPTLPHRGHPSAGRRGGGRGPVGGRRLGGADSASLAHPPPAGALVFEPNTITVAAGSPITFKNNAGFPHNIVFDADNVPVSDACPPPALSPPIAPAPNTQRPTHAAASPRGWRWGGHCAQGVQHPALC